MERRFSAKEGVRGEVERLESGERLRRGGFVAVFMVGIFFVVNVCIWV
tara:strand:- start:115 stop:258 length:144 start_codon:yes stop_codon:yes gene_type:complete